jgi:hypothetical protein
LVFRDDRNAQLLRLPVLGACRGSIVVDQEGRALAHTSRHLTALLLDVSFQLVAVLVVVHVARHHEGQSLAHRALLLRLLLPDVEFLQESLHLTEVLVVAEEADKLGTLLRSDTLDACQLIVEESRACHLDELCHRIFSQQSLSHISATQRNAERIEQMTTVGGTALLDAFQEVVHRLAAEPLEGSNLVAVLRQMIEVGIFVEQFTKES